MGQKVQTISPVGKLNWDDALEVMPSGDCRDRRNVELSETGKYSKLTNIRGDINWDLSLQNGEYIIGGCYDAKREQNILVVSRILIGNLTTGRILAVKEESTTPFNSYDVVFEYDNLFENFTTSALVVNTFVDCKMLGDILLMVDGVNENKAIDIVKAELLTDGTVKSAAVSHVLVDSGGSFPEYVTYTLSSVVDFTVGDTVYVHFDDVNDNLEYGGVVEIYGKNASPTNTLVCSVGRTLGDIDTSKVGTVYKYITNEDFYVSSDDSVSMIIPTPRFAPEVRCVYDIAVDDTAIDSNFGVYQFATSFVYYNDATSLFSTFSEESVNNENALTNSTGEVINTIIVTVKIDRPNVKKVRLYARRILESVSDFYLIEEWDRDDLVGNVIEYNFYGKVSSISTGVVDSLTIQDSIPFASETLDILKENVLALGGNTEGYEIIKNNLETDYLVDDTAENIIVNSTLTNTLSPDTSQEIFGDIYSEITSLTISGVNSGNTDHGYLWFYISDNGGGERYFTLYKDASLSGASIVADRTFDLDGSMALVTQNASGIGGTLEFTTPVTGIHYYIGLIRTGIGEFSTFGITNTGYDNFFRVTKYGNTKYVEGTANVVDECIIPMLNNTDNYLTEYIEKWINGTSWAGVAVASSNTLTISLPPAGTSAKIIIEDIKKETAIARGGFIDDAEHYVVQNYYDKYGRLKYISDIKTISIPYLTTENLLTTYGIDSIALQLQIKDNFPTDVETFSFSVARTNKRWEQYLVNSTGIWDATVANASIGYDADPEMDGLYAIAIDFYSINIGLGGYTFQQGDSARLIAYSLNISDEEKMRYTPIKYRDIIKSSTITSEGYTVIFVASAMISEVLSQAAYTEMNDAIAYVFEVYRDYGIVSDQIQFTECTQRFLSDDYAVDSVINIYNGESFFNDVTQTFFLDGIVIYALEGLKIKSPKLFPSSVMDSRQWGKPIGRDEDSTIKYRNNVRNGGKAFQNTAINNLFRFNYADVQYLNDNYGEITLMRTNGNTLRVYQERNNASIYIGGTEIANQDGTVQIIRSDKVLGSYRYSQENNYGLQVKTGLVDTGDAIYLWDLINGVIVKDNNGMMPIIGRVSVGDYSNDFKMERFFKRASKLVTDKSNYKIALGYNKDNRVLFVSNSFDTDYPTVCFSEEHGFWYQFMELKPKFYSNGSLGTIYCNADDNEIYSLFTEQNDRCLITGVPRSFSFQIVANENGKMNKTFEAISLNSSEAFDTLIEIAPTASYRYLIGGIWKGMKSIIKKGAYRLEEGIFRHAILRNMYPDDNVVKLHNGHLMRGNAATVTFTASTADSANPIEVLAVDVYHSDSSQ